MPHGTPDWGLVGPKQTVYGLDDLGEHAVRMGSPNFFDRRGDVIFLTDFSEGLSMFRQMGSGLGPWVGLSTGNARTGAFAARLMPGPGLGGHAELVFTLAPPTVTGIGLEFSFGRDISPAYWEGHLEWFDGGARNIAWIRVNSATGGLEYYDNVTPWVYVGAVGQLRTWDGALHTLKMVVDIGRGEYVRVILNQQPFSLAGVPMPSPGAVGAPYLYGEVRHTNSVAIAAEGFVDNVIVTQNEP